MIDTLQAEIHDLKTEIVRLKTENAYLRATVKSAANDMCQINKALERQNAESERQNKELRRQYEALCKLHAQIDEWRKVVEAYDRHTPERNPQTASRD